MRYNHLKEREDTVDKAIEEVINDEYKFVKNDNDKTNLAILFDTGSALSDVADVMEFGAKKYNRKNWNKVDDKERYIAAPLRHLLAYSKGVKIDPESNKSHLAHAICSLLFLLEIDNESTTSPSK